MAEKHRFRKEREFKKRLDEQEENEGGDIRNFKFHSFDRHENHEERRPKREEQRSQWADRRPKYDDRSKPRDYKKTFKKNNRTFNDDED